MGFILCLLALLSCYSAAKRSIGLGFAVLLTWGYGFGVLRAWFQDGFAHFTFDAATLGVFVAHGNRLARDHKTTPARFVRALIAWTFFLLLLPIQHVFVQLVGFRAAVYFVPFIILGADATAEDLDTIARWVTPLNIIVFVVALLEYQFGIAAFIPVNEITEIIFTSHDVGSVGAHRIPSTFTSAHAYGGTMVQTIPFLINRLQSPFTSGAARQLTALSLVLSAIGTFICGARMPVVILFGELVVVAISLKLSVRAKASLVVLGLTVAYFVAGSERMQRFTTLADTDYVIDRLSPGVKLGFLEMLYLYPVGSGLGSAWGTNIPYFLTSYAPRPIGMESEFGRIALELTAVGLFLWLVFIYRTLRLAPTPLSKDWVIGTRLFRFYVAIAWGAGLVGTGVLTAMPGAPILLFQMGILHAKPVVSRQRRRTGRPPARSAPESVASRSNARSSPRLRAQWPSDA